MERKISTRIIVISVLLFSYVLLPSCLLNRETSITVNPYAPDVPTIYVRQGADINVADGTEKNPYPRIMQGVNAALQTGYPRVLILKGEYFEKIDLVSVSKLSIEGVNRSDVIIHGDANDSSLSPIINTGYGVIGVMVRNVRLVPLNPIPVFVGIGAGTSGFVLDGVNAVSTHDSQKAVKIYYDPAVGASDASYITILNSSFAGFMNTIDADPRKNISLSNNNIEITDGASGLLIANTDYSFSNFYLSKNIFKITGCAGTSYGVNISGLAASIGSMTLEGNTFTGDSSCRRSSGLANTMTDISASHIVLRDSADGTHNMFNNMDYGLFFRAPQNLTLDVNGARFNGIYGASQNNDSAIYIEDSLNLVLTVSNSVFGDTSNPLLNNCLNGITVTNNISYPRASNIKLQNNNFYYSGFGFNGGSLYGVSVLLNIEGATVDMYGNHFYNQYGNAVQIATVDGGSPAYREVNLVMDGGEINISTRSNAFGGYGVSISSDASSVFTGLSIKNFNISNTDVSGIFFSGSCVSGPTCEIRNNNFANNGSAANGGSGIDFTYLSSASYNFTIDNNTFNNSRDSGIRIGNNNPNNTVILSNNNINNVTSYAGIYVNSITGATISGTSLLDFVGNNIAAGTNENIYFNVSLPTPTRITYNANHFGFHTGADINAATVMSAANIICVGNNDAALRGGTPAVTCTNVPVTFCGCP